MKYPNKIREIRKRKSLTLEQVAELSGLSPSYLSRLEIGDRNISGKIAAKLASALNVEIHELFKGHAKTIPVVGYVGAGAQVWPVDDHVQGAGLEEIEVPWPLGEHAVAVIVRGDSMRPAMREGDILIYDNRLEGDLTPLIGSECILALADGRMFVKELAPGSAPGRYTLLSHNAPPMLDQSPQWAAKINLIWRK